MGSERKPSQKSQFKRTARQQDAQELLKGSQRHTLLVGGARSGKTTLLVHEIVTRALRADASRHAILRFRANAVRPSIALDTLPKVFRFWQPAVPYKHHRTEGYFSLKNKSEIWIAGLDDQERVEKILGKEYATIFLNECSQIPYSSVLVALTRLAQVVGDLRQAAYYDLNPTSKGHWTNILFGEKRDPISHLPLDDPDNYERMFLNPRDNADNLSADYLKSPRPCRRSAEGGPPARRRRGRSVGRLQPRRRTCRRDRHRRCRARRRRPCLCAGRPLAARCARRMGQGRGAGLSRF
jgi:hypothetical protein